MPLTTPNTILDQVDAATVEVQLATFGETIWYKPRTGGPVRITAIVNRHGAEIDPDPRTRRRPVTIAVKPDAAEGIDPDTFATLDEIVVRTSETGTETVTLRLKRCAHSDAGLVTYDT